MKESEKIDTEKEARITFIFIDKRTNLKYEFTK